MLNFHFKTFILAALLFALSGQIFAQKPLTQNLKGVVVDKVLKSPLIGATIVVVNTDPVKGAVSDTDGRFRFDQLPVGKLSLRVFYLGYKEANLSNIQLISGKETEIIVELEENIFSEKEVLIVAKSEKHKPLNELSNVSTRTFSVDETQRFAAAVNDPARMASSFAGVAMPADGNNVIVIRGNAPNGLLWRMEGVDIPNPNHFSSVGTSGGGVSILSAQLLSNSDFMTGAFPAEYGNALSGVFDLKMRKGNMDRREHTLQIGLLGLDVCTEGPIKLGARNGSYLINYRYSTLSILGKIGVPLGDAVTNFQDLSYNVWLPAGRAGVFTLFGMGGKSDQRYFGKPDSLVWIENPSSAYDGLFIANSGVAGLTHSKVWGDKTSLKTVAAMSAAENGDIASQYNDRYLLDPFVENNFIQSKITLSSTLNHKINARHLIRAGAYYNQWRFDLLQKIRDDAENAMRTHISDEGNTATLNAFAQWQYKAGQSWTMNAGLHSMYLFLNQRYSVEPRASIKYQFNDLQSLGFGYGLHSQLQPIGIYFMQNNTGSWPAEQPNRNLDMTRSHHFVLSYDHVLKGNWHIKPEIYWQEITNAPVNALERDAYSLLNHLDGFTDKTLTNTGAGRNYGVEMTVEKYLTKGFYCLVSSSLFNARYRGSNQVWHNTRYNAGYINSLVAGKEWGWNTARKNRTVGVNLKFTYSGGLRDTPIDLESSIQQGKAVYDETRAFEDIVPYYLRMDIGMRLKRNYKNMTSTFSLDIQNATNRKNILVRYYEPRDQKIKNVFQAPLIPVLAYKVEFGG